MGSINVNRFPIGQDKTYSIVTPPYSINSTHSIYDVINDTVTLNSTEDARDEQIAVIEVAVSATILFLAVAGNGCVLASLYMRRRRRLSRMQLMILHLSLADLFVAFFNVLPQLVWDVTFRFQGGDFLCKTVKYLQVVAMYASAYVLLATATDRYLAICHPFLSQSWTPRQAHSLVGVAWVASLVLSLPQLFIFSYKEIQPDVYDCWAKFGPEWTLPTYVTWTTVSIFIIPTCVLIYLYGKISWVVWKAGRLDGVVVSRKKLVKPEKNESQTSSCLTSSHSILIINTATNITSSAKVMNASTMVCDSNAYANNNSMSSSKKRKKCRDKSSKVNSNTFEIDCRHSLKSKSVDNLEIDKIATRGNLDCESTECCDHNSVENVVRCGGDDDNDDDDNDDGNGGSYCCKGAADGHCDCADKRACGAVGCDQSGSGRCVFKIGIDNYVNNINFHNSKKIECDDNLNGDYDTGLCGSCGSCRNGRGGCGSCDNCGDCGINDGDDDVHDHASTKDSTQTEQHYCERTSYKRECSVNESASYPSVISSIYKVRQIQNSSPSNHDDDTPCKTNPRQFHCTSTSNPCLSTAHDRDSSSSENTKHNNSSSCLFERQVIANQTWVNFLPQKDLNRNRNTDHFCINSCRNSLPSSFTQSCSLEEHSDKNLTYPDSVNGYTNNVDNYGRYGDDDGSASVTVNNVNILCNTVVSSEFTNDQEAGKDQQHFLPLRKSNSKNKNNLTQHAKKDEIFPIMSDRINADQTNRKLHHRNNVDDNEVDQEGGSSLSPRGCNHVDGPDSTNKSDSSSLSCIPKCTKHSIPISTIIRSDVVYDKNENISNHSTALSESEGQLLFSSELFDVNEMKSEEVKVVKERNGEETEVNDMNQNSSFLLGESLAQREREVTQSWSKCNLILDVDDDNNDNDKIDNNDSDQIDNDDGVENLSLGYSHVDDDSISNHSENNMTNDITRENINVSERKDNSEIEVEEKRHQSHMKSYQTTLCLNGIRFKWIRRKLGRREDKNSQNVSRHSFDQTEKASNDNDSVKLMTEELKNDKNNSKHSPRDNRTSFGRVNNSGVCSNLYDDIVRHQNHRYCYRKRQRAPKDNSGSHRASSQTSVKHTSRDEKLSDKARSGCKRNYFTPIGRNGFVVSYPPPSPSSSFQKSIHNQVDQLQDHKQQKRNQQKCKLQVPGKRDKKRLSISSTLSKHVYTPDNTNDMQLHHHLHHQKQPIIPHHHQQHQQPHYRQGNQEHEQKEALVQQHSYPGYDACNISKSSHPFPKKLAVVNYFKHTYGGSSKHKLGGSSVVNQNYPQHHYDNISYSHNDPSHHHQFLQQQQMYNNDKLSSFPLSTVSTSQHTTTLSSSLTTRILSQAQTSNNSSPCLPSWSSSSSSSPTSHTPLYISSSVQKLQSRASSPFLPTSPAAATTTFTTQFPASAPSTPLAITTNAHKCDNAVTSSASKGKNLSSYFTYTLDKIVKRAPSLRQRNKGTVSRNRGGGCERTSVTGVYKPCISAGISRAKLKTIKLTLTVVICYIVCWLPFFAMQMWAAFDANAPFQGVSFTIIMLLASVNSCTNPWIYTIFSNTICRHVRNCWSGTGPLRLFATTQGTETLTPKLKMRN